MDMNELKKLANLPIEQAKVESIKSIVQAAQNAFAKGTVVARQIPQNLPFQRNI